MKTKSTLLFITDQFPYPPRNGVTLPTYNHLNDLKEVYDVKLMICTVEKQIDKEQLIDNEKLFGRIEIVSVKKVNKLTRLFLELMQKQIIYHGYAGFEVGRRSEDFLIVSPMSSVAKIQGLNLSCFKLAIAATNDCVTATFKNRARSAGKGLYHKLKGMLDWLRVFNVRQIEKSYLLPFDHVLLQTEVDLRYMESLVSKEIAEKVVLVPNGVNSDLFNLPIDSNKKIKQLLFIAELSGEYGQVASWLVTSVWKDLSRKYPHWVFTIVGKGASEELQALFKNNSINHIVFVNDLNEEYEKSAIALCPVFKGFGLINKTIEAMASGVPVVGGEAAFNGIADFQPNVDGIVCESKNASQFKNAISDLIESKDLRYRISGSAREKVRGQFDWSKSTDRIKNLLDACDAKK